MQVEMKAFNLHNKPTDLVLDLNFEPAFKPCIYSAIQSLNLT